MNPIASRALPAIVVAAAVALSTCGSQAAADMDLRLTTVRVSDAGGVTAVQLVNGAGTPLLVSTDDGVSLIADAQPEARALPAMKVVTSSTWEARRAPDGELTVLYTQAGSAVSWVMSKTSSFPGEARINQEAFGVYLQPHFVRESGNDGVTAVRHADDATRVVFFSYDAVERQRVVRELGVPGSASILDARLVRAGTQYWLIALVHAPEEASAPPRGDRKAGILTAERLDASLNGRGVQVRVLRNQPVYEFDVQPAANGEVAILATTPAGAIYARGTLADEPLPQDRWRETPFATLTSPSLLLENGVTHVAALERAGEANARVLRGRTD